MGNVRAIYLNDQGESKRRMSADIMYIIVDQRALGNLIIEIRQGFALTYYRPI